MATKKEVEEEIYYMMQSRVKLSFGIQNMEKMMFQD
eukprot:CAMPEP_0117011952 /NCGR_PEP_ID=MMETSP0472-20121206/10168_1 /TAXON_ID=693140 ORGANISM="Tiarina fusus, Strain LIS" /NCGR_SAMPLE_ID=MMETSP0472 /ASSEMBLY_ACC=CAM_ASM_000603 /LENGTH=35 /DNA_ID= /DNA_START= /DNA_END= /DNA_ORIENTATION=